MTIERSAEQGLAISSYSSRSSSRSALCILHSALCILVLCTGCAGAVLEVHVTRPAAAPPAEWVVAVFPLDDSGVEQTVKEYSVYGITGAQGSGAMFARGILRALPSRARFRGVEEEALRKLMLDEKLSSDELSRVDDARACELARKLRANLAVCGRIAEFRSRWFLYVMPRATVLLELRGLDPATGERLWSARVGDTSMSRSEPALVSMIAAEAVHAVAEGVGAAD